MPRIGIISDIHSNLEALEAVLKAIESRSVEIIVHLGDSVGYNANPSECLQILRQKGVISVLGNHDLATLEPQTAETFNVLAYEAIRYSQHQLTASDLRYLQNMPRVEVLWDRYLFCHGTPENLQTYILNMFQAKRTFNLLKKCYEGIRVCFFGHTHQQKFWIRDQRGKVSSSLDLSGPVSLEPDNLYLINPGSVGQSRQHDNRAHYLIFDSDRQMIWFEAVSYEIEKTQRKILQAGLPEYLAIRLQDGT